MQVVRLAEYRNRELVEVIKGLLQMAEDGDAQGLVFVVKIGRGNHRPGVAGDYRRFPDEALPATLRMQRHLMKRQPAILGDDDEEAETDFADSGM